MEIAKYYIIGSNNVVLNVALFKEEDAEGKSYLKRHPIVTELGMVDVGWQYLPNENTFLPPPRDILAEWASIRASRNAFLFESDRYVMKDYWDTYTQDEKQAWTVYRQNLRDIPTIFTDPREVIWPVKPEIEAFHLKLMDLEKKPIETDG